MTRPFLRLIGALLIIDALFLGPYWVLTGDAAASWIALEASLAVGVFALLPRARWSTAIAGLVAVLTVALSLLVFADEGARQILGRPLNLYLDVRLSGAVVNLLEGALGGLTAALIFLGGLVGAALVIWLLTTLLSPIDIQKGRRPRKIAGLVLVAFASLGIVGVGFPAHSSRTSMPGIWVARDQVRHFVRMLGERDRFETEMEAAPASYSERPGLLAALEGRDVILAFLESYGVSALDDPRYSSVVLPRLQRLHERVTRAGLHIATGTLVAPSQGGQSWLGHMTVLSGLWVDNQLRYDVLLASGRETLIDDFRRAGHRTVTLMPATTMAWPEGERFGYDQIFAFDDMNYGGPPLNWVTMPDQFTWSFLEEHVRRSGDPRALFAEVGLISSHAPWTPILPVLEDWEAIGDGSVFARFENTGESPAELWQDYDRVREQYALSLGYALEVMGAYAERYVDDRTLLIVLGDHQPAPLITGEDVSRAVPVHVISGDETLVRPFVDWGFKPGVLPDPGVPSRGMDAFRSWFVGAFSVPETEESRRSTAAGS